MTTVIALALGLLLTAGLPARSPTPSLRVHELPGATAFPESIGVDARTGTFFTGSVVDGTVFRGALSAHHAEVFLTAGSDGRTAVAGVKVDDSGRIWVADAFNGRVLVYSQTARLMHTFVLQGAGTPTVNDLAFSHGDAYVTDSARPFLYRLSQEAADRPGTTSVDPWLPASPAVTYHSGAGPLGVNLNGIVASADGRTLLTVQTNTGILFRVDVEQRTISPVDVGPTSLQFGDGLLRIGDHLYVARNASNEIVKMRLDPRWRAARLDSVTTSGAFAFPTALAETRGRLFVTNAQLDTSTPQLPFTVVDLPVP